MSSPYTMDEIDVELDERAAPPRSPLRVMQILAELAKSPDGTSLVRLSEQLQLPKTSLFSLLRSLEAGNYITSDNGYHRLGQESFNLAASIRQSDGLAGRLRPLLQKLQHESNETVMLAIPSADWSRLLFADVIEAESSLRFTARVGAERPLYSTSVGLALLAYATADIQKRYIENTKLTSLTPTTITTGAALRIALKRIRIQGYVVNSGSVLGLAAIAVPVFSSQGNITASVSVAGPSTRIEERSDEFIRLALEAGRRMSQMLGYKQITPR